MPWSRLHFGCVFYDLGVIQELVSHVSVCLEVTDPQPLYKTSICSHLIYHGETAAQVNYMRGYSPGHCSKEAFQDMLHQLKTHSSECLISYMWS